MHQQWKAEMEETSESEYTENMQSNERETGEETQDELMSIIPSQAAAEMDSARTRSERTVARREPENETSLRMNPESARAKGREMEVEEEKRVTRHKFIQQKQEHEANVNRGVNIPQLNKEQMRQIKV
jgi:hypothetical protein